MSDSNWSKRGADLAQWGGGLVTFIVCLIVTWLIAAQYGEDRGYAEAKAKHAANSYSEEIKSACDGFAGPELTRCSHQVQKSAQEAERAEYDLQAQREVALWTSWMMLASGAGILLTMVGLYFLAGNLVEMRKQREASEKGIQAAEASAQASRGQTRAYLSFTGGEYQISSGRSLLGGGTKLLNCRINLFNGGQTPARQVKITATMQVSYGNGLLSYKIQTDPRNERLTQVGNIQTISADKEATCYSDWHRGDIGDEAFERLLQNTGHMTLETIFSFVDVFNMEHSERVNIRQGYSSDDAGKRSGSRSGALFALHNG